VRVNVRAIVLLVGMIAGVVLASMSGTLSREDVLPPVIALGIALPLGWTGLGALRRR
jgi:hypothetical protein